MSRSTIRITDARRDVAAIVFESAHAGTREKLFFVFVALPDAGDAKEEWIGRTETMQFHFVTRVPAPFERAKYAGEFTS